MLLQRGILGLLNPVPAILAASYRVKGVPRVSLNCAMLGLDMLLDGIREL